MADDSETRRKKTWQRKMAIVGLEMQRERDRSVKILNDGLMKLNILKKTPTLFGSIKEITLHVPIHTARTHTRKSVIILLYSIRY